MIRPEAPFTPLAWRSAAHGSGTPLWGFYDSERDIWRWDDSDSREIATLIKTRTGTAQWRETPDTD